MVRSAVPSHASFTLWNFLCAHIADAIGKVLAIWIRFRASQCDEAKSQTCDSVWKFRTVAVSILSPYVTRIVKSAVCLRRATRLNWKTRMNGWISDRQQQRRQQQQNAQINTFASRSFLTEIVLCKEENMYIYKNSRARRIHQTHAVSVSICLPPQWRQSRSLCARTVNDADDDDDAATALQLSWTNIYVCLVFLSLLVFDSSRNSLFAICFLTGEIRRFVFFLSGSVSAVGWITLVRLSMWFTTIGATNTHRRIQQQFRIVRERKLAGDSENMSCRDTILIHKRIARAPQTWDCATNVEIKKSERKNSFPLHFHVERTQKSSKNIYIHREVSRWRQVEKAAKFIACQMSAGR